MEYYEKDKFIKIPKSLYNKIDKTKLEKIKEFILKGVREGKIEFPYSNIKFNLNEIKKINPKVEKASTEVIKKAIDYPNYAGESLMILNSFFRHKNLNDLTDYFSQEPRMKCFTHGDSPFNYFASGNWVEPMIKSGQEINKYSVREFIYNNTRECTLFPIYTALAVIDFFKAKKWLDPSMGWGDRLISALLSPTIEKYVGTDPNPRMTPIYKEIVDKIGADAKGKKIELYSEPFELLLPHLQQQKEKFDLIFTSPPFFDKEVYIQNSRQSYIKYDNEEQWFEEFLWKSFKTCFENNLEIDGHLVLYLGNFQTEKYILWFLRNMNKLPNCKFMGSLWMVRKSAGIRPIYVWRKI